MASTRAIEYDYCEYEEAVSGVARVRRIGPNAIIIDRDGESETLTYEEAQAEYAHAAENMRIYRDLYRTGDVPESAVFECTEYVERIRRALSC